MAGGFMEQALDEARAGAAQGEVPVGAVLVVGGEILARAHNLVEARADPTAHAELVAFRAAAERVGAKRRAGAERLGAKRLTQADLYVTLEPCAMCAQAIAFARLRRLYFGAYDPKGGGVDHGARIFRQPTCHHRPEIVGGLEERRCAELLEGFFQSRR